MILNTRAAIGSIIALLPVAGLAEEHKVDQLNKQFSVPAITIKVGDSIRFVNSDSYYHNVYSLSEQATFDLGSYPKGKSRAVTFGRAGEVKAECAIHPQMILRITVEN